MSQAVRPWHVTLGFGAAVLRRVVESQATSSLDRGQNTHGVLQPNADKQLCWHDQHDVLHL